MSIYRSRPQRPDDDDVRLPVVRDDAATPPKRGTADTRDYAPMRKAKPANYMLPSSLKWFAALPFDVRPMALVTRYPRIANVLALHWSRPAACRAYFDDLLVDHRGTRQGFPADVQRDLVALHDYYVNRHLALDQ
jgi:hypothetical protein